MTSLRIPLALALIVVATAARGQAPSPGSRSGASMTWDATRGTVILFGGRMYGPSGPGYLDDLWEWNGRAWSRVAISAAPPPRDAASLAADSIGVMLFGGRTKRGSDTDVLRDAWRLEKGQWDRISDGPAVLHAWMLWHPVRRTMLLVGGFADTAPSRVIHEHRRNGWVAIDSQLPAGRMVMAARPTSDGLRVVLGSPDGTAGETWDWSATGWRRIGAAPGFSSLPAFTSTPRGLIIAEARSSEGPTRVWREEPNGSWSVDSLDTPPWRTSAGMAYDLLRDEVVLYGGSRPTALLADTWVLAGGRWSRRD